MWHFNKLQSTHLTVTYVDKEKTVISHSLRCFLIDVKFGFFRFLPFNVTRNISFDSWKCFLLQWLFECKSFQFQEIA